MYEYMNQCEELIYKYQKHSINRIDIVSIYCERSELSELTKSIPNWFRLPTSVIFRHSDATLSQKEKGWKRTIERVIPLRTCLHIYLKTLRFGESNLPIKIKPRLPLPKLMIKCKPTVSRLNRFKPKGEKTKKRIKRCDIKDLDPIYLEASTLRNGGFSSDLW